LKDQSTRISNTISILQNRIRETPLAEYFSGCIDVTDLIIRELRLRGEQSYKKLVRETIGELTKIEFDPVEYQMDLELLSLPEFITLDYMGDIQKVLECIEWDETKLKKEINERIETSFWDSGDAQGIPKNTKKY